MNSTLPYLLTLLQEYGYPTLWLSVFIAAAGIPLPTSLVLLAAGAFAALGDFNLIILLTVTTTAFVAGDNLGYLIGRLWGSKVLDWLETSDRIRFIKPRTIARSRIYFNRRGSWAIFFSRFLVSALGGVINILAGAQCYPYRRFMLYDLGGELLGALLPLMLGYVFGASWDAVGDILGSFSLFFLALLFVLFLGYQAIRTFTRLRRLEKRQDGLSAVDLLESPTLSSQLTGSDRKPSSSGNLPL